MEETLKFLILFILFIVAMIIRKIQGSWFAPGSFFSLFWFVNLFSTFLFASSFTLHVNTVLLFFLLIFIFAVGSSLGMSITSAGSNNIGTKEYLSFLKKVSLIFSLIGFLSFPFILYSTGGNILLLLKIESLMNLARENSIDRYSGNMVSSNFGTLLLSFNYTAALINGIVLGSNLENSKKTNVSKIILYLPIITSILIALILTTKATILYTSLLFLSGYIVIKEFHFPKLSLFTIANIKRMLIIGPVVFFIFVFIQMSRYGFNNLEGFFRVISIFKIWAFGHLPAFSSWFENIYLINNENIYYFGKYTFGGVFSILGISDRLPGVYSEGITISSGGEATNIFTAMRGLIEDFGLIGTTFILFITSFIFGVAYKQVKAGNYVYFSILSVFYCFTLFSFVISILVYNSILLAFILFWLISFSYFFITKYVGQKG
ncbi:O-antigen polymerase [Exiguobacterium aurantiacum]|uniref:O-antigen polymerase n=1 Tax=Exiguobacterium aurantiacum TaxID=33987 RepID=UPI001E398B9B|nr:O-antigen polymerase [Exiguobacterium aurantiacum]